jgi:tripartite-type tricarboxylate transporter receptor subunit TctC
VPFAAGGSTDVVARIIAQKMSEGLGQQVIIENVAGAGGSTGAARVAKAEPDGYTILMGTVATHALNPLMLKRKPYDAVTDFAPVSLLVIVPNVLVVHPSLPAKTVPELVALLKADPAKYNYASSVQEHRQSLDAAHCLSRLGTGSERCGGRPSADHVRQPAVSLRVHPGWHLAGHCRDHQGPCPVLPGHAHHRRGRVGWL